MASDSRPFVGGRHVQLLKPLAGALLMAEIAVPAWPMPSSRSSQSLPTA